MKKQIAKQYAQETIDKLRLLPNEEAVGFLAEEYQEMWERGHAIGFDEGHTEGSMVP